MLSQLCCISAPASLSLPLTELSFVPLLFLFATILCLFWTLPVLWPQFFLDLTCSGTAPVLLTGLLFVTVSMYLWIQTGSFKLKLSVFFTASGSRQDQPIIRPSSLWSNSWLSLINQISSMTQSVVPNLSSMQEQTKMKRVLTPVELLTISDTTKAKYTRNRMSQAVPQCTITRAFAAAEHCRYKENKGFWQVSGRDGSLMRQMCFYMSQLRKSWLLLQQTVASLSSLGQQSTVSAE